MTDKQKAVSRTAAPSGTLEAVKLEALTPTRAERLKALEQEFSATSERSIESDGKVRLGLKMSNGDVIVGRGVDTEAALAHLEQRVALLRAEG